jgi:nitrogen fixation protein FixH
MMRPVDYSKKKRVNVSDFKHLQSEKAKGNRLKQVATQKGKDWVHEEEVRWFLRDDPAKPVTKRIVRGRMRAFILLPHSCIKRVTVGYRSPQSLVRTVLELRKMHKAKWEVARATLSLNSFQFDEELVTEG